MASSVPIDPEILEFDDASLQQRIAAIKAEVDFMSRECGRHQSSIAEIVETLAVNQKRLQMSKRLPLLIATVSEIVDVTDESVDLMQEVTAHTRRGYDLQLSNLHDRAASKPAQKAEEADDVVDLVDGTGQPRPKLRKTAKTITEGIVIKTTSRYNIFLPKTGAIPRSQLKPTDLVAVNRDTYFLYEKLPAAFDSRVRVMEVTTKPKDTFEDLGGIDPQIAQIKESFLLPLQRPDLLKKIGIKASKGVLLYGSPGTGKTAVARALANAADCSFLQLTATQLVQLYIGEGSAMVIEAFNMARSLIEKSRQGGNPNAGCIIYIDELDAIGGRRSDTGGADRDSTRTMLTLLNCLDGFDSDERIKVLASTNRVDILDPALTRSGRFDRKIEFTPPNEKGRYEILKIHSRKMKLVGTTEDDPVVPGAVGFMELAKSTPEYSGAMLKAVCMEAGLVCLRRNGAAVEHEDFIEAVNIVQGKKDGEVSYFI